MRVGIVTLYGTFNYGNRLQNYALHTALTALGHDVVTLVSIEDTSVLKGFYRKFCEKENGAVRLKTREERRRDKAFIGFTKRYIPTLFFSSKAAKLPESLNSEFDRFVVGSDQVWNPLWWGDVIDCGCSNDFLLKFAAPKKRVAYSASFGVSEIPAAWQNVFCRELEKFSFISVREHAGAEIVRNLLGRDACVTLDPTMLLSADEWRRIKVDLMVSERYIFQFNLGEKSEEQNALVKKLCDSGYSLIDYMDPSCEYFGGDPSSFLSLLDGAACVLTDSFHASVFSILFNKPFVVFDRKHVNKSNMNSRIATLLSTFGLEERWQMTDLDSLLEIDYVPISSVLESCRKASIGFLVEALN